MPHIGFPHSEPDIRHRRVKTAPIGATALLTIKLKGILKAIPIMLYIVIIEYVSSANHAEGTCIYMIFTVKPCW